VRDTVPIPIIKYGNSFEDGGVVVIGVVTHLGHGTGSGIAGHSAPLITRVRRSAT
jgi:hypothetical protein